MNMYINALVDLVKNFHIKELKLSPMEIMPFSKFWILKVINALNNIFGMN